MQLCLELNNFSEKTKCSKLIIHTGKSVVRLQYSCLNANQTLLQSDFQSRIKFVFAKKIFGIYKKYLQ